MCGTVEWQVLLFYVLRKLNRLVNSQHWRIEWSVTVTEGIPMTEIFTQNGTLNSHERWTPPSQSQRGVQQQRILS